MKITNEEFLSLKGFMYDNYGINMENKTSLIEGRLSSHLEKNGFRRFADYIDYVVSDTTGEAVSFLVSKLTTNFTYFMREAQHYDFLTKTILPEWEKKITNKDLRIWSAGCSSGEEPYTTQIIVSEYFKERFAAWDTTLLATDISSNVLNIAKAGVYSGDKLKQLPEAWRSKYFMRLGEDRYKVTPELRKKINYAAFNLMESVYPFKRKFHVIFCRNVMIYFDNKKRTQVANQFYNALEPGGYLIIGLSETFANLSLKFKMVKPSIYTK